MQDVSKFERSQIQELDKTRISNHFLSSRDLWTSRNHLKQWEEKNKDSEEGEEKVCGERERERGILLREKLKILPHHHFITISQHAFNFETLETTDFDSISFFSSGSVVSRNLSPASLNLNLINSALTSKDQIDLWCRDYLTIGISPPWRISSKSWVEVILGT